MQVVNVIFIILPDKANLAIDFLMRNSTNNHLEG